MTTIERKMSLRRLSNEARITYFPPPGLLFTLHDRKNNLSSVAAGDTKILMTYADPRFALFDHEIHLGSNPTGNGDLQISN